MMKSSTKQLKDKTVMVTGAAGFIGSRLCVKLIDHDTNVIGLVNSDSSLTRLEAIINHPRFRLVPTSLNDEEQLACIAATLPPIDLLAHLDVTVPGNNNFWEQAIDDISMNLIPAMNLLRLLSATLRGICFASSVSVYGKPATIPVNEASVPHPQTSYAAMKLAMEKYLEAYGVSSGIPVTSLRYSTVYGPGEFGHRAIPNFLIRLQQGIAPCIYGDGSEQRDYVYIDDVVTATISALAKQTSGVFNIGSGKGYSTLEVAEKVIELAGAQVVPEFVPSEGARLDLVCDITTAGRDLEYCPRTSLDDGLRKEFEWCKNNINLCYQ